MQRAGRGRGLYRLVRRARLDGAASLAETVATFLVAEAGRGLAVNILRLCHAALHYLHLLVGDQRSKALKIGNVERQQTLHVVITHRRDDVSVAHRTGGGTMCHEDCAAAVQHPSAVQTCVASRCAASCHNEATVDSAARRNDAFMDKFGHGLLANRLGERP